MAKVWINYASDSEILKIPSMTRKGVDAIRCLQDSFGYLTREQFLALPQIRNSKVLVAYFDFSTRPPTASPTNISRSLRAPTGKASPLQSTVRHSLQYDSPPPSWSNSPEPERHNSVGESSQTHVLNSLPRLDDILFDGTGEWDSFYRKFSSHICQYPLKAEDCVHQMEFFLRGWASDYYQSLLAKYPQAKFSKLVRLLEQRFARGNRNNTMSPRPAVSSPGIHREARTAPVNLDLPLGKFETPRRLNSRQHMPPEQSSTNRCSPAHQDMSGRSDDASFLHSGTPLVESPQQWDMGNEAPKDPVTKRATASRSPSPSWDQSKAQHLESGKRSDVRKDCSEVLGNQKVSPVKQGLASKDKGSGEQASPRPQQRSPNQVRNAPNSQPSTSVSTQTEESVNPVKTQLSKMEDRFKGVETRLSTGENQFHGLKDRLRKTESQFNEVDKRIRKANSRVDRVAEKSCTINSRVDLFENRLGGAETQFHGFTNQLGRAEYLSQETKGQMLAVEERVHKVEDQYNGVEHRVSGSEAQLNKVTSQLKGLENRLGQAEDRGDLVGIRLDEVENRLTRVEDQLTSIGDLLGEFIGATSNQLEQLQEQVQAIPETVAHSCQHHVRPRRRKRAGPHPRTLGDDSSSRSNPPELKAPLYTGVLDNSPHGFTHSSSGGVASPLPDDEVYPRRNWNSPPSAPPSSPVLLGEHPDADFSPQTVTHSHETDCFSPIDVPTRVPNTLPTITPVALMGATGGKPARGEAQTPTPVKAECIRFRVHINKISSEARAHTISAQTASPLPLHVSFLDSDVSGGGTPVWDSCHSDEFLDMSDAGQFVQTEQDLTEFPECDMVDDDSPPQSPPLGPAYDFPSGAAGLDEGKERDEQNPCVDQWDQTSCERASRPSGNHRGAGDGQEIPSTLVAQPRVDHPGSSTGESTSTLAREGSEQEEGQALNTSGSDDEATLWPELPKANCLE